MNLPSHILLTAPFAGGIAWHVGFEPACLVYGGAVLIDLDHYLFYILRTRRYDPLGMFAWFAAADRVFPRGGYYGLHLLHAVEVYLLVAFLAITSPSLVWVLCGMFFHLLLDLLWLARHPILHVRARALSWTEHLLRRRRGEREFWRDIPISLPN